MKTQFTILSRHNTLAEAVAAAGVDVSYNPEVAADYIKHADKPYPNMLRAGIYGTMFAYVVAGENGPEVYHAYTTNHGKGGKEIKIRHLAKFSPFVGVLSNADMVVVSVNDREGLIVDHGCRFPKTDAGRKELALRMAVCAEIYAMR